MTSIKDPSCWLTPRHSFPSLDRNGRRWLSAMPLGPPVSRGYDCHLAGDCWGCPGDALLLPGGKPR